MRIRCQSCDRALDFSGDRPSFCAFCGSKLTAAGLSGTATYQPDGTKNQNGMTQLPPPGRVITFTGDTPDPETIGGYKVLRKLGTGGMGAVFEAEDTTHGRKVAVKVVKPQVASSPENLERFRQEGRLASLIAHPRCVFVYQADEDQGRPYIVMELMPGATLKDIVTQQGPLQVGQAIRKILDVIEGLSAAHQIGFIHRDVKPSNCFVLTDGHVKVGDFGLSKFIAEGTLAGTMTAQEPPSSTSGAPGTGITRTGAFVGTPLFASPEQIKGEPLDFRSDIYSVCATLYFLLTGKAPFEGGDNTATIARIVSEDPAPPSSLRREIPVELDRIILRGLERNREVRYDSLAELKQALLPFVPGFLQAAPRLSRIRAAVVDLTLLAPPLLLISRVVPQLLGETRWETETVGLVTDFFLWLIVLGYFLTTEVIFGASFGKWLLRLRVGGVRPGKQPKRRQLLLRAFGFFVIVALPGLIGYALTGLERVKWTLHALGGLLLIDTMRARGGYRGLHEIISGTCVASVPVTQREQAFPAIVPRQSAPLPPGMPRRIGSYAVQGIHRVLDDRIFLEGIDLVLDRPVWLVLRPREEGRLNPARREISRGTRLRWLGGGDVALEPRSKRLTHHWDAFIAPTSGCSLTRLVALQGRLTWAAAKPLLRQLAEELATSLSDGTFPDELGPEQVWLQPDGQLLVIGARFHDEEHDQSLASGPNEARSMLFLQKTAVLMLEGAPRQGTDGASPGRLRAPVPSHDRSIVDRLMGSGSDRFTSPGELVQALKEAADRPSEVTPLMRLGQLLLLAALLSPILLAILVLGRFYREIGPSLIKTHQIRRAERVLEWLGEPSNATSFRQFVRAPSPTEEIRWMVTDLQENARLLSTFLLGYETQLLPQHGVERFQMMLCSRLIEQRRQEDLREQVALRRQLSFAAILPYSLAVELLPKEQRNPSESAPSEATATGQSMIFEELRAALEHAREPQGTTTEALPRFLNRPAMQVAMMTIGSWFVLWIFWSMLTHGGLSLRLMGIDLLRQDGSWAGPLRCGLRTLLIWLPFFTILLLSVYLQETSAWSWVQWLVWWLAVIYLAGCAVYALLRPQRGLHDRLTGVYLMPR